MAKPLIYVAELAGKAKIYPGEFLGPQPFKAYRAICQAAGASFDPKLGANVLRLGLLQTLLDGLQVDFTVKVAPEVIEAVKTQGQAISASRAQAQERLSKLKDRPYPFQGAGVAVLAARNSFLLADEMGLGKTVQALLAIPDVGAALVLCPASLKGEWLKACLRWRPDYHPEIADSFRLPMMGEIIIINYERLPVSKKEALVKVLKPTETLMSDALAGRDLSRIVLIGDEFHYIKSSKSGRTQRWRELARAIRAAGGRTWGLTGTPMPNTPMDLLNVLTALDLLKESFGSYPRFCHMMNGRQDYWGKWIFGAPRPGAVEALRRVMLRRRRVDVLPDLPTITYEEISVDVKASARKASDQARAAMAAAGVDLQAVIDGSQGLGASSDTVFTARRLLAEAKIAAVVEIVEAYEEAQEPLIVFSAHRAPIDALGEMRGLVKICGDTKAEERSQAVADFQAGKFNTIALTIKAGAVGFTLTRAAHVLMVDEEWTPDWNQQAVSRACRIGQTRGVLVKRLRVPDSIDTDVGAILDGKQALIDATIEKAASGEKR